MIRCPLEEALIPGNIVEVTSNSKVKMGVILSNNQVAYFKNSIGYDKISSLIWRNNHDEDDYYISRVYAPEYGFTIDEKCDNDDYLNCIYCKCPRYPYEVIDGVEYEMVYGGETFICKNMKLFGEDVVVYKVDGYDTIKVVNVCEFGDDQVEELVITEEGSEYDY